MPVLKNIRGLIFDVDDTLYRVPERQHRAIGEYFYQTAEKTKGWKGLSLIEVRRRFDLLKIRHKSTTLTLQKITGMSTAEILLGMDKVIDPLLADLEQDKKLTEFFSFLKKKKYFVGTLRNGTLPGTVKILQKLLNKKKSRTINKYVRGIDGIAIFATAETGFVKPSPEPYRRAIDYSGISAKELLMLGELYDKDLATAKEKFGMQIALVDLNTDKIHRSKKYDCLVLPNCRALRDLLA